MSSDKSILITSGAGSFGRHFVRTVLEKFRPRDELRQFEMQDEVNGWGLIR